MKPVRILNGSFDPVTLKGTTEWAHRFVRSGQRGYICTVNVAILMMMRSDPWLRRFIERASLVVADGEPLVWVSRLQGTPLPERVTGIDLVDELCALAVRQDFGVYFLGAEREVIEAVAARLAERHPGLTISGFADGYFDAEEAERRAAAIRESGAKILIVGMGVPRQERFIEDHWDELGVGLAIPVGGSFDVIAGAARRAPRWLQRIGMEWSFRLAQEPRRLWKRYLVTNTQFLSLLFGRFSSYLGHGVAGLFTSGTEPVQTNSDEPRDVSQGPVTRGPIRPAGPRHVGPDSGHTEPRRP
jgi:N-acetylglucosaminyldiphosphoundecaprenol N-acetyl-beta-D-mannosaminyltransferase